MIRPLLVLSSVLAHCVSAAIQVKDGKLSLVDSVGANAVASTTFTSSSPSPLSDTPLSATDTLKLSFLVQDEQGNPLQPHQAFISFQPVDREEQKDHARQWAGIVKVRSNGKARWELDLSRAPTGFLSLSEKQISATLLLGTPHQPGLSLPLGIFHLSPALSLPFPYPPNEELPKHWEVEKYSTQPEIEWTFRSEEKKVGRFLSTAGLLVVLAPWTILMACLSYLVPSLSLRRPTPSQLIFLISLISFESLFILYWVKLRLIETVPYFLGLGVVTFGSGKRALGEMRRVRNERERKEGGKDE